MNAHFHDADDRGGKGSFQPLICGQVQSQSDNGLSGGAKEYREAQAMQIFQMMEGFQIHFVGFAKSDPGVQNDPVIGNAGISGDLYTFFQIGQKLF